MATNPNIILAATQQPVQVEGPLDTYNKLLTLQRARGAQQLQDAQITEAQQSIEARQRQMEQMQALNDAYRSAITPGEDGNSTIDTERLTNALAQGGHGAAIPTVLKGVTDYQKTLTDLKKDAADLRTKQTDFAGGVGYTLQQAGYDPHLFLTLASHAVADKAVNPAAVTPLIQQVQQS